MTRIQSERNMSSTDFKTIVLNFNNLRERCQLKFEGLCSHSAKSVPDYVPKPDLIHGCNAKLWTPPKGFGSFG